ncbi:hypothetical protein GQ600_10145 [Phytophthora cactorum]|nr:hypothetical protein GQ600_10145 [Phytophthora cactorum]
MPAIMMGAAISQLDVRSLRYPQAEHNVREKRIGKLFAVHQSHLTLYVCYWSHYTTESMDFLDQIFAWLHIMGMDGDGIGDAATRLGMSRSTASCCTKAIKDLLYDLMQYKVKYLAPTAYK